MFTNVTKMFSDSAKEFKNIKSLVTAALLLAIRTVLAVFVSIQLTESLRISFSFLANVVIGCLFGPVMGFACGAIGDIVQFVIKPTGTYFPGWTLNAALACFIYGLFFYGKLPKKKLPAIDIKFLVRVIIALTLDTLIVNVILGTCWVNMMFGKGFFFYLASRFGKNIIQLPINIFLSYYILGFLKTLKIKKND